jgi:hypothetical protein
MDHHPLAHAGVKQCAGGAGDIGDVRLAVGQTDFQPAKLAGFQFIDGQVVKMRQRRQDQRPVARIAFARHQIEGHFIASLAHLRQQSRAAGAEHFVGAIEAFEQQQIAEMENFQRRIQRLKGREVKQAVGAGRVKEVRWPSASVITWVIEVGAELVRCTSWRLIWY